MSQKYILIVGASSGIGAATAKALSNSETTIILMARRVDQLEAVQKTLSGNSIIAPCDVCDYSQIDLFFQSLREKDIKLSALIYTAGICYVKTIKMMTPGDLDEMFRINVFGFYEMCRRFQSPKISERGASIIALSSYASISKETGMSAYSMTKSAINSAVKVMSKEFAKREIRVNAILPAHVMSKMASEDNDWNDSEIQEIREKQALGIIPIEEIVSLIRFLLSDETKHMTGELLTISAGYYG